MAAKPKAPRFSFLTGPEVGEEGPEQVSPFPAQEPTPNTQTAQQETTPPPTARPGRTRSDAMAETNPNPAFLPELLDSDPATAAPATAPTVSTTVPTVPAAPVREERRAFSTRLRPSLKRTLDAFVMDLKLAGWPVSQELVLEALVRRLRDDDALRAAVTGELTGPNRES